MILVDVSAAGTVSVVESLTEAARVALSTVTTSRKVKFCETAPRVRYRVKAPLLLKLS